MSEVLLIGLNATSWNLLKPGLDFNRLEGEEVGL
jgi:hypothetical protein